MGFSEVLQDDALHFAARPQHGVRKNPHQVHIPGATKAYEVGDLKISWMGLSN